MSRRRDEDFSHNNKLGGYRVYVGDIGQRINRTDLEKEFGQYGPVTEVWMGRKGNPAMSSFAFVVYRYPEDAEEAVRDRNGRKVCGRQVVVEHAKPFTDRRRDGGGGRGGRGGFRGRGFYGGGGDRGNMRGGGNRDYDGWYGRDSRDMPPRGRSRSRSRERYRRSPSPSHGSNSGGGGRWQQQSPMMDRRRNDSFSDPMPPKLTHQRLVESPEPNYRHKKKSSKSRKQMSTSPSPPPKRKSKKQAAPESSDDSNSSSSGSRSPSPPPKKKKKKKKKQRTHSSSGSPPPHDAGYDAKEYRVPPSVKSRSSGSDKKGRDGVGVKGKPKSRYEESEGYSSSSSG